MRDSNLQEVVTAEGEAISQQIKEEITISHLTNLLTAEHPKITTINLRNTEVTLEVHPANIKIIRHHNAIMATKITMKTIIDEAHLRGVTKMITINVTEDTKCRQGDKCMINTKTTLQWEILGTNQEDPKCMSNMIDSPFLTTEKNNTDISDALAVGLHHTLGTQESPNQFERKRKFLLKNTIDLRSIQGTKNINSIKKVRDSINSGLRQPRN